jgi:hypothetical protein
MFRKNQHANIHGSILTTETPAHRLTKTLRGAGAGPLALPFPLLPSVQEFLKTRILQKQTEITEDVPADHFRINSRGTQDPKRMHGAPAPPFPPLPPVQEF